MAMDIDIVMRDIKKFTALFNKIIKALINDEIKYTEARFLFYEELNNLEFETDMFVTVIKNEELLSFDTLYDIVVNKMNNDVNTKIEKLFNSIDFKHTLTKHYLYKNDDELFSGTYDECITKFSEHEDINNLHIYIINDNIKTLIF